LLMAGQEPPAAALTWLFDRLGREPLLAEHVAAVPDDEYTDAIVRETLRLHPPVHSVVRLLTRPLPVGGNRIPAGTVVMVPMVLLHRDPAVFPDPDRFDPERFRSGRARFEDLADAAYLPFGGGTRRCLGEPLAHAEIGSVLPAVLRRMRLRPLRSQPERMVVRGTVLVPQLSMLTIAEDR
jgi:cytochrome P450 family 135